MDHTFTLKTNDIIPPSFFNERKEFTLIVKDPRKIKIDDINLELFDNEPDLPVGEEVQVWLSGHFKCETTSNLFAKKMVKVIKQTEEEETKKLLKSLFTDTLSKVLKDDNLKPSLLKTLLDNLRIMKDENVKEYKLYWHSPFEEEKKKSNTAYLYINEISKSINMISSYIKNSLNDNNFSGSIYHSYSPRHNVKTSSANHFVLDEVYESGKYKREPGDALCRPSEKFWQLEKMHEDDIVVDCQKCLDKMLSIYTEIYNSMKNKPKMK